MAPRQDPQQMKHLSHHPEAQELLLAGLPMAQPCALKHAYLSAVMNVRNNPVCEYEDPRTKVKHIIGFGDIERTIPLVIIVEAPPDSSIRHAFSPNPSKYPEGELLKRLAQHEYEFANEHKLSHRNIEHEMRYMDRDRIASRGLSGYDPPEKFDDPYWNEYKKNFYPTDAMSMPNTLSTVDMTAYGDDHAQMSENIRQDINRLDSSVKLAGFDLTTRERPSAVGQTLAADNLRFKIDPQDSRPAWPSRPTKRIKATLIPFKEPQPSKFDKKIQRLDRDMKKQPEENTRDLEL